MMTLDPARLVVTPPFTSRLSSVMPCAANRGVLGVRPHALPSCTHVMAERRHRSYPLNGVGRERHVQEPRHACLNLLRPPRACSPSPPCTCSTSGALRAAAMACLTPAAYAAGSALSFWLGK